MKQYRVTFDLNESQNMDGVYKLERITKRYGNNNYCTLRLELCFRADNWAQLGKIHNRVNTCTYQTIKLPD